MADGVRRLCCRKRGPECISASHNLLGSEAAPASRPSRAQTGSETISALRASRVPTVAVVCRSTRFETTVDTLLRLGPCYLSMQSEIDTSEPIHLDYSAAAFQVLLDALTVAHLDLSKALLHVARSRVSVVDLEALLQFVLLGWVLGISLPLPPPPAAETPRGDKFGEFRNGFTLRSAYQGESGVFHHLVKCGPFPSIPCRYQHPLAPAMLLLPAQEYEEPADRPRLGCVPLSIEMDTLMVGSGRARSEGLDEWAASNRRVCEIHMLQVTLEQSNGSYAYGDIITMHAGSAAIVDLGPRHVLLCEGIVLGMNRTAANRPDTHRDMLTVDMLSDLDHSATTSRLACQPLEFDGDLITYFRLSFSTEIQRLGRMFRLRIDPFHPKVGDYIMHEDLMQPLYMLRSLELFGTLLELPPDFCAEGASRAPFAFEPEATSIQTRRFRVLV